MYLAQIQLTNIKGFPELDFDFARPDGGYPGWNVVVGGNSSGKTTLLKAIALALFGPEFAASLLPSAAGWVREGAKEARIVADLRFDEQCDLFTKSGNTPHDIFKAGLRFVKEKTGDHPVIRAYEERKTRGIPRVPASRGPWNPNAEGWFAVGYGPMRRLTGSSAEATRYAVAGGHVSAFVTLFREDAALSESEEWLKKLRFRQLSESRLAENSGTEGLVDDVKRFLNDGLLPASFQVTDVTPEHVYVEGNTAEGERVRLPMRDLSDGCRSAYALILDIICHFAKAYDTDTLFTRDLSGRLVINRPGVVLLDEVEAHLHPSWQRRICDWLKERFPKVQFIVTSHSPLIVQAADRHGIYVLPIPDEDRRARRLDEHEYERVVLGRAEKVLLGEAFGLTATWSQRAQRLVDRWQSLNARKHASSVLTSHEEKEYGHLRRQMEIIFEDEARMP
ncbi:MAG: AAA family ATPase [Verrucomicrobia bacterium]|nr:AAA family ATPase [Verrucomicrobiota bacterium]